MSAMSEFYGWQGIIDRLEDAVGAFAPEVTLFASEKFGGLRVDAVNTGGHNVEINSLIQKAEEESHHVCEACGRPGLTRNRAPWVKTLCDEHAEAYYEHGWRWWEDGFEEDGITAKLPFD